MNKIVGVRKVIAMSTLVALPPEVGGDVSVERNLDVAALMRCGARVAGVALAIGQVTTNCRACSIRLLGIDSRSTGNRLTHGEANGAEFGERWAEEEDVLVWAADQIASGASPVVVTCDGTTNGMAFFRYRCLQRGLPLPELRRPDRPCRTPFFQDHLNVSDALSPFCGRVKGRTLSDLALHFHLPITVAEEPEVHIQSLSVIVWLLTVHWYWLTGYMDGPGFSSALADTMAFLDRQGALEPLWREWIHRK